MREKSQTAELFAAANAGELIWKALFAHGLLFSHCMQMCCCSCLTRIRCVPALSFQVPSPSCDSLDDFVNLQNNKNNNLVGVQLLSTYLPSSAARPRLVPLMLLPAPRRALEADESPHRRSDFFIFSHIRSLSASGRLLLCLWSRRRSYPGITSHILHQNSQHANLHLFVPLFLSRVLLPLITQWGSMKTNINVICAAGAS